MKRVVISDVAKKVGVHPSTVSRVLNVKTRRQISPSVVENVLRAAEELGYRPNAVAAGLRTKSTKTLGFIVPNISDPIYPPVLKGIEAAIKDTGFMVLVGNADKSVASELDLLDRMSARIVDGVILGTTRLEDELVDRCLNAGLPAVTVMRRPAEAKLSSVTIDNIAGMRQVVELVLRHGHRKIAVIAGPQHFSTGLERFQACIETLHDAGVEPPGNWIVFTEAFTVEEGEKAAATILEAIPSKPTAIICVNDLVATGAISACQNKGLNCPNDVSITGFNDMPFSRFLDPPLTTVHTDPYEIGFQAGKRLIELIVSGTRGVTDQRLKPLLVERASVCDCNTGKEAPV